MINSKIEQYLIQKKLGNGAMGSVYLALDTSLDRPVALKFILSDFNDHPQMAARFLAEAKVLASLNRPNIPILYGYFMWQGKGVMAMEYVDGETLEGLIRQRGPIPANVSIPLVKQALQGLAAAHRIGVVHRDLKPGNIMVNKEGTVKVVDFGIAKKIEGEAGLTGTNATIGTPWYMSPEQIMGKPVTACSDIYSMGVVLYELLAGQVPFHADSIYEIHTAHVQKTPEPPTVHYPHIPPQIVAVVMKALQKDPKDRFSSAEEFLRALPDLQPPLSANVVAPIVVEAKPVSAPEPAPQTPLPDIPKPQQGLPAKQSNQVAAGESHLKTLSQYKKSYRLAVGAAACAVLILLAVGAWFVVQNEPKKVAGASPNLSSISNQPQHQIDVSPDPAPSRVPARPATASGRAANPNSGRPPVKTAENTVPNHPENSRPALADTPPQQQHVVPAGQELSGTWSGTYTDTLSPTASSTVQVRLQEHGGTQVDGTLSFTTANNMAGQCSLQGSNYSYESKKLVLLTHCSNAPAYFNFPATFSVMDPTEHSLSGKAMSRAKIALQR